MVNPNPPISYWVCVEFAGYVVIGVDGLDSCRVKLRVYDYMSQPKPDPFINHIKVSQPTLTRNAFTINFNPFISCWVRVGFMGRVKLCHP